MEQEVIDDSNFAQALTEVNSDDEVIIVYPTDVNLLNIADPAANSTPTIKKKKKRFKNLYSSADEDEDDFIVNSSKSVEHSESKVRVLENILISSSSVNTESSETSLDCPDISNLNLLNSSQLSVKDSQDFQEKKPAVIVLPVEDNVSFVQENEDCNSDYEVGELFALLSQPDANIGNEEIVDGVSDIEEDDEEFIPLDFENNDRKYIKNFDFAPVDHGNCSIVAYNESDSDEEGLKDNKNCTDNLSRLDITKIVLGEGFDARPIEDDKAMDLLQMPDELKEQYSNLNAQNAKTKKRRGRKPKLVSEKSEAVFKNETTKKKNLLNDNLITNKVKNRRGRKKKTPSEKYGIKQVEIPLIASETDLLAAKYESTSSNSSFSDDQPKNECNELNESIDLLENRKNCEVFHDLEPKEAETSNMKDLKLENIEKNVNNNCFGEVSTVETENRKAACEISNAENEESSKVSKEELENATATAEIPNEKSENPQVKIKVQVQKSEENAVKIMRRRNRYPFEKKSKKRKIKKAVQRKVNLGTADESFSSLVSDQSSECNNSSGILQGEDEQPNNDDSDVSQVIETVTNAVEANNYLKTELSIENSSNFELKTEVKPMSEQQDKIDVENSLVFESKITETIPEEAQSIVSSTRNDKSINKTALLMDGEEIFLALKNVSRHRKQEQLITVAKESTEIESETAKEIIPGSKEIGCITETKSEEESKEKTLTDSGKEQVITEELKEMVNENEEISLAISIQLDRINEIPRKNFNEEKPTDKEEILTNDSNKTLMEKLRFVRNGIPVQNTQQISPQGNTKTNSIKLKRPKFTSKLIAQSVTSGHQLSESFEESSSASSPKQENQDVKNNINWMEISNESIPKAIDEDLTTSLDEENETVNGKVKKFAHRGITKGKRKYSLRQREIMSKRAKIVQKSLVADEKLEKSSKTLRKKFKESKDINLETTKNILMSEKHADLPPRNNGPSLNRNIETKMNVSLIKQNDLNKSAPEINDQRKENADIKKTENQHLLISSAWSMRRSFEEEYKSFIQNFGASPVNGVSNSKTKVQRFPQIVQPPLQSSPVNEKKSMLNQKKEFMNVNQTKTFIKKSTPNRSSEIIEEKSLNEQDAQNKIKIKSITSTLKIVQSELNQTHEKKSSIVFAKKALKNGNKDNSSSKDDNLTTDDHKIPEESPNIIKKTTECKEIKSINQSKIENAQNEITKTENSKNNTKKMRRTIEKTDAPKRKLRSDGVKVIDLTISLEKSGTDLNSTAENVKENVQNLNNVKSTAEDKLNVVTAGKVVKSSKKLKKIRKATRSSGRLSKFLNESSIVIAENESSDIKSSDKVVKIDVDTSINESLSSAMDESISSANNDLINEQINGLNVGKLINSEDNTFARKNKKKRSKTKSKACEKLPSEFSPISKENLMIDSNIQEKMSKSHKKDTKAKNKSPIKTSPLKAIKLTNTSFKISLKNLVGKPKVSKSPEKPKDNNNSPKENKSINIADVEVTDSPVAIKDEIKEEPEDNFEGNAGFENLRFRSGDLAFAQLADFPLWPCMITNDPQAGVFYRYLTKRNHSQFHVRFFADNGRRAWVFDSAVFPYNGPNTLQEMYNSFIELEKQNAGKKLSKGALKIKKGCKVTPRNLIWGRAVEEAETLIGKSTEERHQLFDELVLKEKQKRLEKVRRQKSLENKAAVIESKEPISVISEDPIPSDDKAFKKMPLKKTKRSLSKDQISLSESEKNWNPPKRQKLSTESRSSSYVQEDLQEIFKSTIKDESLPMEESANKPGKIRPPKSLKIKALLHVDLISECSVSGSETSSRTNKADVTNKSKKSLFKDVPRIPVCEICLGNDDLVLKCKGSCCGYYHVRCASVKSLPRELSSVQIVNVKAHKKHYPVVSSDTEMSQEEDIPLLTKLDQKLEKVMQKVSSKVIYKDSTTDLSEDSIVELVSTETLEDNFICSNCKQESNMACNACNSKVFYGQEEERIKCSVSGCGKTFHRNCMKFWPQSKMGDLHNRKLLCPMHYCHTCISSSPHDHHATVPLTKLVRCLKCPATYHVDSFCIPAGTQILSPTQVICPRHIDNNGKRYTVNVNWCFICSRGGNLLCCETCPTAVHQECMTINLRPDESFICEDCEWGRLPLYDEIVWAKFSNYKWWPALVLFPSDVPRNVFNLPHRSGQFVVRFFGTHDHCWIGLGKVFLFLEGDKEEKAQDCSKSYEKAMEEAKNLWKLKQGTQRKKKSEKPPPYKKLRVNRPVGKVKLFDGNVSNTNPCSCSPFMENPCGPGSGCLNRILMTECDNDICPAKESCQNQRFEKRLYADITAFKTDGRGWGLKCSKALSKGDFVIEYVGELLDQEEYQRRIRIMHEEKQENFYFLFINSNRIIDAGLMGNLARFMNHCCKPNCETQKWTVRGEQRVGLFAIEDVPAGTELTFNYNLECVGENRKICMCGADTCSGFIGVKSSREPVKKPPRKTDPCFVCSKPDCHLTCSNRQCGESFHKKCAKVSATAEGNWMCPRHTCAKCKKRSSFLCTLCVTAYCWKHLGKNLQEDPFQGSICKAHRSLNGGKQNLVRNTKRKT